MTIAPASVLRDRKQCVFVIWLEGHRPPGEAKRGVEIFHSSVTISDVEPDLSIVRHDLSYPVQPTGRYLEAIDVAE
jgi:hypothetical protein